MKNWIRTVCFLVFFVIGIVILGDLMRPKRKVEVALDQYHNEHSGLYYLEKDTVDVLYIGSSHVFSSISPEDIFHKYGITGYVQSSSCQTVWQSYYYLQETYETQKPKAVVLDTFMALNGNPQTEPFNREAIDKMRLSPAKLGAIKTAVEYNPEVEDFLSYLFPLFRYHSRWEELKKEDYIWFFNEWNISAKGFLARMASVPATFNIESYENAAVPLEMPENCKEYLAKIKLLCEENGSQMILTKFPTCLWNKESSLAIREWADENGIPFLDYNADDTLRKKANIQWETDSLDGGNHLNYQGAMKMSDVFGAYLTEEFSFADKREDASYQKWQDDYNYYKRCVANHELSHMTDLTEYWNRLKQENYAVIFSTRNVDLAGAAEAKKQLTEFGVLQEILEMVNAGSRSLFIMENGIVTFEKAGEEDIVFSDLIAGEEWWISSAAKDTSTVFACIKDRQNYAKEHDGVQFIVWDSITKNVVDCACGILNEEGKLELREREAE